MPTKINDIKDYLEIEIENLDYLQKEDLKIYASLKKQLDQLEAKLADREATIKIKKSAKQRLFKLRDVDTSKMRGSIFEG